MDNDGRLFADFIRAENDDLFEDLRRRSCPACAQCPAGQYEDTCHGVSCGYVSEGIRLADQVWLIDFLMSPVVYGAKPTAEDVRKVADWLVTSGASTLGPGLDEEGNVTLMYAARSLRGIIHGLVSLIFLGNAGVLALNVEAQTNKQIAREASAHRDRLIVGRQEWARRQRPWLADRKIAERLGLPSVKTLRDWLGPRGDDQPE